MERLKKNIVANYFGKMWGFFSVYLFVPVYLHFLGVEAYGLVGFYMVLLSTLAIADMGLTATLSREMARLSVVKGSEKQMRQLVRTIELLYVGISALIAVSIFFLADPISQYWLTSSSVPASSIKQSIRLMGFAVAFQLPAYLYLGGLLGLQRQVLANTIQVSLGVFRSGGAAVVLWLVSSTIEAFFLWQVLSSALLLLLFRRFLWINLPGNSSGSEPSLYMLKGVFRYSAGMAIISFNAIILMQIDKVAISKMLSLELLGYYSLAWIFAQTPTLLSTPISVAVFPTFTQLTAAGKDLELAEIYHRSSQLTAAIVFPVGLTLAIFSQELMLIWTPTVATRIGDKYAPCRLAACFRFYGAGGSNDTFSTGFGGSLDAASNLYRLGFNHFYCSATDIAD